MLHTLTGLISAYASAHLLGTGTTACLHVLIVCAVIALEPQLQTHIAFLLVVFWMKRG
jgi:hypothetical protein